MLAQVEVASMVVLEGDRAAVVGEAVGFDDEPLLTPEEVDLPAAAALRALGDLARLQAAGAYVGAKGAAVLLDPNFLEVRIEAALGGDHRVASGVAERRSLAAAVAYLGHRSRDGT
jgi:hypothetical protein